MVTRASDRSVVEVDEAPVPSLRAAPARFHQPYFTPAYPIRPTPTRKRRTFAGDFNSTATFPSRSEERRELGVDGADDLGRTSEESAASRLGDLLQHLRVGFGAVGDREDARRRAPRSALGARSRLARELGEEALLAVRRVGVLAVRQDDDGADRTRRLALRRLAGLQDRIVESGA